MANSDVWALALYSKHGYVPGDTILEPETATALLRDHPDDFVRVTHSATPARIVMGFDCDTRTGWVDPEFAHLFGL